MTRSSHEHRGKDEVVRIFWIESERFLSVSIALVQIAFGIPVDREIAISKWQRKLLHGLFHQRQALLKLAVVNRHLAEPVQRNGSRDCIRGHVEYFVEDRSCFVPLAGVVAIEFAKITERRWIGRLPLVCLLIKPFGPAVLPPGPC